jgi:hypothetical protein
MDSFYPSGRGDQTIIGHYRLTLLFAIRCTMSSMLALLRGLQANIERFPKAVMQC